MTLKIAFFITMVGVMLSFFGILYGLACDEDDGRCALFFARSLIIILLGGVFVIFSVKIFDNIFLQ